MRWLVTFLHVNKHTRKRATKAKTVAFDTELLEPEAVEREFEARETHPLARTVCKGRRHP